ncbi:MAG: glycosyltransferase [Chloroherpetonaceae bacterium]|nr:glycosyltransferase [Chloroherpetonaceae bacterium]
MNLTIAICTYNPEERYFKRCLLSLSQLTLNKLNFELLIVDNFSSPPISERFYVQEILKSFPHSRIIVEQKRGTAFARCRAIQEAKGEFFLFVDDDVELSPDYLVQSVPLFEKFPNVAIWGAGKIQVEFLDLVDKWVHQFNYLFTERNFQYLEYGCNHTWNNAYPVGMGMIFRPEMLRPYAEDVFSGKLTIKGRDGKSLVTNEDTQMIWYMTAKGFAAGSSPDLKLRHLIPSRRTTLSYLARLNYGISVAIAKTNAEVYPDKLPDLKRNPPRFFRILKTFLKLGFNHTIELQFRRLFVDFAFELGIINGRYRLAGIDNNIWIRLARFLNFE